MKKQIIFIFTVFYALFLISSCTSPIENITANDHEQASLATSKTTFVESTDQSKDNQTEPTDSQIVLPTSTELSIIDSEKSSAINQTKATQSFTPISTSTNPKIKNVNYTNDVGILLSISGDTGELASWYRFALLYIEMVDADTQNEVDYTKMTQPRAFTQNTENNNIINRAIEFSLYCYWLEKEATRLGKDGWFIIGYPSQFIKDKYGEQVARFVADKESRYSSCESFVIYNYYNNQKLSYTDAQKKLYCEKNNIYSTFNVFINNYRDTSFVEDISKELIQAVDNKKVSLTYITEYVDKLNSKYKSEGYDYITINMDTPQNFMDETLVWSIDKSNPRHYLLTYGLDYKYVYFNLGWNSMWMSIIGERDFYAPILYDLSLPLISNLIFTINMDKVCSFYESKDYTKFIY